MGAPCLPVAQVTRMDMVWIGRRRLQECLSKRCKGDVGCLVGWSKENENERLSMYL